MNTVLRGALGVAVALGLSSCNDVQDWRFHQLTFNDAGSAAVAVLSVRHWEDARQGLQPSFKMDADTALKAVLPVTGQIDQRTLVDTIAKASIQPVGNSRTVGPSSGTTTPILNKSLADALPALAAPASGALSSDPVMKYLAATALYQEVDILNNYVKNAVTWEEGNQAYLVNLRVSLMPQRRDLPLDALTELSFLPFDVDSPNDGKANCPNDSKVNCPNDSKVNSPNDGKVNCRVEVVPLLVTDNLESLQRSRSGVTAEEFGLNLQLLLKALDVTGDFQQLSQALAAQYGHDLNSLFTVARIAHDTVSVRFGASATPGPSEFTMLPMTHDVSVMVVLRNCIPESTGNVVAKAPVNLTVMAHTNFVLAQDGFRLQEQDEYDRVSQKLSDIRKKYRLNVDDQFLLSKAENARKGLWPAFNTLWWNDLDRTGLITCDKKACTPLQKAALWTELQAIWQGSPYSWVSLMLHPTRDTELPKATQTGALVDGKDGIVVTLNGGKNLLGARLGARLNLGDTKTAVAAKSLSNPDGLDSVTITFPSLAGTKLTEAPTPSLDLWLCPSSQNIVCSFPGKQSAINYKLVLAAAAPPPPPAPTWSLTVADARVLAKADGTGQLDVVVHGGGAANDASFIQVDKGLASAKAGDSTPAAPLRTADGVKMTSAGEVMLSLINLYPGESVTVSLHAKDGTIFGQPVIVPIVPDPTGSTTGGSATGKG